MSKGLTREDVIKNQDVVDQIKDNARRSTHAKVKRRYTGAVCKYCGYLCTISTITVGFGCSKCHKYQSADEAVERYENGEFEHIDNSSKTVQAPSIVGVDPSKREYSNLRDEMEIRADMFVNGQTRDSMGLNKFDRTLKKNLIKNKCYRGPEKVGI